MVLAKSKIPLGLYDINKNLIKTFINQVELANYLNIHKSTVGKYYKSGKFITLPRKINIKLNIKKIYFYLKYARPGKVLRGLSY